MPRSASIESPALRMHLNRWLKPSEFGLNPLRPLRVLLGVILLLQILSLLENAELFWGANGLIQAPLKAYFSQSSFWSFDVFTRTQDYELISFIVYGGLGIYFSSVFLVALGYSHWGLWAILNLLHLSFMNRSHLASYGLDQFARIALFYILMSSLTPRESLLEPERRSSIGHLWQCTVLRLFQWHLALGYFVSGLEKALGVQWWNGEAIWRSLTLPRFSVFDLHWLTQVPILPVVIGISTVLLELIYPLLIALKSTRRFALLAIILLHLSILILMDLKLFSLTMIALNLSAYWFPYREPKGYGVQSDSMVVKLFGKSILVK